MNINLNKKTISAACVYAIVLFLFVFLFLIIPFPKSASSWICFAFTIISLLLSMGISAVAFSGKEGLTSKIYGYPIFKIGIIYAVAQFAFTLIVCLFGLFLYVPHWISIAVSVIFMCLAAIGTIATDNTRDVIEAIEKETRETTKEMKYFRADVSTLAFNTENTEIKKELEKLSEMFKYSDPVSNEKTAAYESELFAKIEELRASLSVDTGEDILRSIKEIKNLLAERNRICKLSK